MAPGRTKLKAVFFDAGGTIVDETRWWVAHPWAFASRRWSSASGWSPVDSLAELAAALRSLV